MDECTCLLPDEFTLNITSGQPDRCAFDAQASWTITVSGIDGKSNYVASAPTVAECLAMMRAIGVDISVEGSVLNNA